LKFKGALKKRQKGRVVRKRKRNAHRKLQIIG